MEIIWLSIAFVLTALVAAAEMATFSARPERMRQASASGDRRGTLVLVYQRSPIQFLAVSQVLATGLAFYSGALTQSAVAPFFAESMKSVSWIPVERADSFGLGIALLITTLIALVVSGVVPKQIGFDHADSIAMYFSRLFWVLIKLLRPLTYVLMLFSRAFERMSNRKMQYGNRVTEHDLLTLLAEGIRIGSLDADEATLVRNSLALSDKQAQQIMLPLAQAEVIQSNWDDKQIDSAVGSSTHSYLPVLDGKSLKPMGVLRARDWLTAAESASILSLLQPVASVTEDSSALALLNQFRRLDVRLLFVVNASGETTGIVTLHDAISNLTGEMKAL